MSNFLYKQKYIILTFFVFCTFVLYGQSLLFDFFIFDDNATIYSNTFLDIHGVDSVFWYWKNSLTPIIYNFWQLITFIFGRQNPLPFRVINFLIHAFNTYLIYLASLKLTRLFNIKITKMQLIATALIFLVHPLCVENIVWVSGMRALLASFFTLKFLIEYLDHDLNFTFFGFILFVLSLLVDPIFGGIILFLPFLNMYFKVKLSFLELFSLVFFLVILFFLHKGHQVTKDFFSQVSILDQMRLANLAFYKYMQIIFFPIELAFDYNISFDTLPHLSLYDHLLFLTKSVLILSVPFIFYKKNRIFISFLFLLIIAFLMPNTGIALHDFNNLSIVANRYAYLSIFPASLLLSIFILKFVPINFSNYFFKAILGSLFVLTSFEIYLWSKPNLLFDQSILNAGLNIEMLTSKVASLLNQNRIKEADSAVELMHTSYPTNLGNYLTFKSAVLLRSKNKDAIQKFLKAYSTQTILKNTQLLILFSKLYLTIGNNPEARKLLIEYLRYFPNDPEAQFLNKKMFK